MGLSETEALVLRTYNLAEADKIVVCLTHGHGLIRGVAKGCRKLRNRFGAALEPFTLLQISFYQKENHELVSLRHTEILRSHFNLLAKAEVLAGLAYMADLVIDFSPPYQPNDKMFRMVRACLGAVAQSPADLQTILRYFEIWLLKLEGFLPEVRHCGECHLTFGEEEVAFIDSTLVLRCRQCSKGEGKILSRRLQRQLSETQRLDPIVFAKQSHEVSAETFQEMGELTHRLIGRVLEREPRIRPRFQ